MASQSFELSLAELTHIVIDAGYGSTLNEHIENIEDSIRANFDVTVECLYTYDNVSCPHQYIPRSTESKKLRAESVSSLIGSVRGPIVFEMHHRSDIAFMIIHIIAEFVPEIITIEYISHIRYVCNDDKSIRCLVLTYDTNA